MLSVLITTKGRKSLLAQTLNAVFHHSNHRDAVAEVIIINDGDDDFSDLAAQYPISIYKNRGRGLAAGRNTGAFYATTNNLLFYDDDILPTPDHFVRHLEIRNKFPQALITGNRFYPKEIIDEAGKTPFGRYKLNHEYNWLEGCDLKKIEGEEGLFYSTGLAGFSCSVPKNIWEELGGFNEHFPYAGCEDMEFFERVKKKNYKLIFDEKNLCFHNELDNFTLDKWLLRQARGIKGALIITQLHPEGKNHPTYYLNTPIHMDDNWQVRRAKWKKKMLASNFIHSSLLGSIKLFERLHFPDQFLFKLYNAAWIGATYKSFQEAYHKQPELHSILQDAVA